MRTKLIEELQGPYPHSISPKEKFRLVKYILLMMTIIFILVATAKIFFPNENTDEVWNFITIVLPGIFALLIKYYFESKHKNNYD